MLFVFGCCRNFLAECRSKRNCLSHKVDLHHFFSCASQRRCETCTLHTSRPQQLVPQPQQLDIRLEQLILRPQQLVPRPEQLVLRPLDSRITTCLSYVTRSTLVKHTNHSPSMCVTCVSGTFLWLAQSRKDLFCVWDQDGELRPSSVPLPPEVESPVILWCLFTLMDSVYSASVLLRFTCVLRWS